MPGVRGTGIMRLPVDLVDNLGSESGCACDSDSVSESDSVSDSDSDSNCVHFNLKVHKKRTIN